MKRAKFTYGRQPIRVRPESSDEEVEAQPKASVKYVDPFDLVLGQTEGVSNGAAKIKSDLTTSLKQTTERTPSTSPVKKQTTWSPVIKSPKMTPNKAENEYDEDMDDDDESDFKPTWSPMKRAAPKAATAAMVAVAASSTSSIVAVPVSPTKSARAKSPVAIQAKRVLFSADPPSPSKKSSSKTASTVAAAAPVRTASSLLGDEPESPKHKLPFHKQPQSSFTTGPPPRPMSRASSSASAGQLSPGKRRHSQFGDADDLESGSPSSSHGSQNGTAATFTDAHSARRSGEQQKFVDNLEYIIDGLQTTQSLPVRCLSIVSLANECLVKEFRMHMRAFGTMNEICGLLQDPSKNKTFALCTSVLLYIMTRDKHNLDVDLTFLKVLIPLLSLTAASAAPARTNAKPLLFGVKRAAPLTQTPKHEEMVGKLHDTLLKAKSQGMDIGVLQAQCLNGTAVIPETPYFALEVLASVVTHARADHQMNDYLRSLGVLDVVVELITSLIQQWEFKLQQHTPVPGFILYFFSLALRILETVTFMSAANKAHLVETDSQAQFGADSQRHLTLDTQSSEGKASERANTVDLCLRGIHLCNTTIQTVEALMTDTVQAELLFTTATACIRVLINLTNDSDSGCEAVRVFPKGFESIFAVAVNAAPMLPLAFRYDMVVLGLGLLINIVEHDSLSRDMLIGLRLELRGSTKRSNLFIHILCHMFLSFSKLSNASTSTDSESQAVLQDSEMSVASTSSVLDIHDYTAIDNLSTSFADTERNVLAAYAALLLGCLVRGSSFNRHKICEILPKTGLEDLANMLKEFIAYQRMAGLGHDLGSNEIIFAIIHELTDPGFVVEE